MNPELKKWIEELKQYKDIGRALDGKDPAEEEPTPGIEKSGIIILCSLIGLILLLGIMQITDMEIGPVIAFVLAAGLGFWGYRKIDWQKLLQTIDKIAQKKPQISRPLERSFPASSLSRTTASPPMDYARKLEIACWILLACCLIPFLGFFFIVPTYIVAIIAINRGKLAQGIIALVISPFAPWVGIIATGTYALMCKAVAQALT